MEVEIDTAEEAIRRAKRFLLQDYQDEINVSGIRD